MSLTDIELDGVTYKSYISVSDADNILAVDPIRRTAWAALDDDGKALYLIAATQRLDLLGWQGERAGGNTQETAWPRSGLVYPDGESIADDVIPADLERATALLAGSILARPAQADHGSSAQSISEIRAGSVQLKYFRRSQSVQGQPLQDETAYALVRRWIIGTGVTGGTGYSTTATGTGAESCFTSKNPYGFTEGL